MNSEKNQSEKNTEILKISVNVSHYKNWSVIEGIREIIQNTLDTIPMFKANIEITHNNEYTVFKNDKGILKSKHWVIGGTDKASDDSTIGQFGEGLKAGLVILLSSGYEIRVISGNYQYEPYIEYDNQFDIEILKVKKIKLDTSFTGTIVYVMNLEENFLTQAKSYFLYFEDYKITHEDKKTKNQILTINSFSTSQNKIYLNGQKIKDISQSLLYSYNIITKNVNRDRDIYDKEEIEDKIIDLIINSRNKNVLSTYISYCINDEDKNYFESSIWNYPEQKSYASIKSVLKELYGSRIALHTNSVMASEIELKGYRVLEPQYTIRQFLRIFIKTDSELLTNKGNKYKYFKGRLPKEYRHNLNMAKKIINHLLPEYKTNEFKYKVFTHTIEEILNSEEILEEIKVSKTLGYADYYKKHIGVRYTILQDLKETIGTIYHELTHHNSHYTDNTRNFEIALVEPLINVMLKAYNQDIKPEKTNKKLESKLSKVNEVNKQLKSDIETISQKNIELIEEIKKLKENNNTDNNKPNNPVSIKVSGMDKVRIRNGNILLPYRICDKVKIKPNYTGKAYISLGILE